jgi:hypothetical protein
MSTYLTELPSPTSKDFSQINRAKQKLMQALDMSSSIKEVNQMLFSVRCWSSESARRITNLTQKINATKVVSKEKESLLQAYNSLLEQNKTIANEMHNINIEIWRNFRDTRICVKCMRCLSSKSKK